MKGSLSASGLSFRCADSAEIGFGSVGGFLTTYTGVAIVLRLFFGALPDRLGPKRVLLPS